MTPERRIALAWMADRLQLEVAKDINLGARLTPLMWQLVYGEVLKTVAALRKKLEREQPC